MRNNRSEINLTVDLFDRNRSFTNKQKMRMKEGSIYCQALSKHTGHIVRAAITKKKNIIIINNNNKRGKNGIYN